MRYAYFILTILLTMAICSGMASAQVYKWVDEDGNTHYGDRPKEGSRPEAVRLRRTPEAARQAAAANQGGDDSGGSSFMEKRTEKKMAADNSQKDADREAALKRYCSALQERIRVLTSGQALKTINANGETEWYDADRTKRETERAKNDFKAKCSSSKK